MAGKQLNKTLTALAGEFLVAAQLCMRGFVASLTLKNYPGVDIFVLNPTNGKQTSVQVKTILVGSRRPVVTGPYSLGAYFVPEKVDDLIDTPFVFVTIDPDRNVQYFVVPCDQVAAISARERDEYFEWAKSAGRTVNPVQPRMISLTALEPFRDCWGCLRLN